MSLIRRRVAAVVLAVSVALSSLLGTAGPAAAATQNRSASCNFLGFISKTVTTTFSYGSSYSRPTVVGYSSTLVSSSIVVDSWSVTYRTDDGVVASKTWTEHLKSSKHNWTVPDKLRSRHPRVVYRLVSGGDVCLATTWSP